MPCHLSSGFRVQRQGGNRRTLEDIFGVRTPRTPAKNLRLSGIRDSSSKRGKSYFLGVEEQEVLPMEVVSSWRVGL